MPLTKLQLKRLKDDLFWYHFSLPICVANAEDLKNLIQELEKEVKE